MESETEFRVAVPHAGTPVPACNGTAPGFLIRLDSELLPGSSVTRFRTQAPPCWPAAEPRPDCCCNSYFFRSCLEILRG